MASRRKTRDEKLAVIRLEGKVGAEMGRGDDGRAGAIRVDAVMRMVRKGMVATINDLRVAPQEQHGEDAAYPITMGIFAWITAHAAVEQEAAGKEAGHAAMADDHETGGSSTDLAGPRPQLKDGEAERTSHTFLKILLAESPLTDTYDPPFSPRSGYVPSAAPAVADSPRFWIHG